MAGNTFLESFTSGFNMAHTIENSKRVAEASRRQAQVQRMQMMKMAHDMAQPQKRTAFQEYQNDPEAYEKFKGVGRSSPTTAMGNFLAKYPDATPEEVAAYKRTLSTSKDTPTYSKGWNEQLGKLQGIRKSRLKLESGTSEFGIEFKITPIVQSSIDQFKAMEKRQTNFLKKRFPKEWADYITNEAMQRKPGETVGEYIKRTQH